MANTFFTRNNIRKYLDARDLQILSLLAFLTIGIYGLEWETKPLHILAIVSTCLVTQVVGEMFFMGKKPLIQRVLSIKSGLITSLSLSILLRADSTTIVIVASFIAIAAKFILRVDGKHLFNPANLGIIVAVKFIHHAWISPAQWGNDVAIIFIIGTAAIFVLSRVERLDTSITFLLVYFIADYLWNCACLGWDIDVVFHKFSSGALYLFAFFMITDPKTTPDSRVPRIIWTACVAIVASVLANGWYINAAPLWALVVLTPVSPFIDRLFPMHRFNWNEPIIETGFAHWRKHIAFMCAVVILWSGNTTPVYAFCGFYAARADIKLLNKSSQVILVRDGEKTTVTMASDFQGDVKDFAMIIPVLYVPKRDDISISSQSLFERLEAYSTPRLAEYHDRSPCENEDDKDDPLTPGLSKRQQRLSQKESAHGLGVTIEAEYTIGQYDIVILSAEQSGGVMQWLTENGYKIPPRADAVLEPYINNGLKFFVAKVNLDELKKTESYMQLRPIQITYSSSRFMLPIRLGMANAETTQDLTIYAFSKKGQVETVNYRTVKMPTDKNVPLFVRNDFGRFYANVFSHQYEKKNRGVVFMEYAWDVSPQNYLHCDPCVTTAPSMNEFAQAGVDWAGKSSVYLTRLHIRYTRDKFPQDLTLHETFNQSNYQVRYVVHDPARYLECDSINAYLDELHNRRESEVDEYVALTGSAPRNNQVYIREFDHFYKQEKE